jgi:hypothetical protein
MCFNKPLIFFFYWKLDKEGDLLYIYDSHFLKDIGIGLLDRTKIFSITIPVKPARYIEHPSGCGYEQKAEVGWTKNPQTYYLSSESIF